MSRHEEEVVEAVTVGDAHFELTRSATGRLELRSSQRNYGAVYSDFSQIEIHKPAARSLRQPLARALGLARARGTTLRVVDATAGLGGDTWLMAALGCEVIALERSPVVFALLEDGLRRARSFEEDVIERIDAKCVDACDALRNWKEPRPDVVFLDPMFPPKRKAALERKEMRALRSLVGSDEDAEALLDAAIGVATRRVVVKRPLHAGPLAPRPASEQKGKSMRYDVYLTSASDRLRLP